MQTYDMNESLLVQHDTANVATWKLYTLESLPYSKHAYRKERPHELSFKKTHLHVSDVKQSMWTVPER